MMLSEKLMTVCITEVVFNFFFFFSVVFLPTQCYSGTDISHGPVSMSVWASVTSQCSVIRDKWINLLFGMEASFDQSCTVFSGNLGIYKNNGISLCFFLNSGLRKFCDGVSIVERAIIWAPEGGCSELDKLDRRWPTELIVPPSSNVRSL